MSDHSHEQLCATVDTIFEEVLSTYVQDYTTPQYIEQTVSDYVGTHFDIAVDEELYVKALIGDINYMNVSDILDGLMFHKILEKCCKYDDTTKIMLIVLITGQETDNS